MTIHTPEWVRDAVFYQIFPDRFARSAAVAKPAHLQPWGAPPTHNGFQGGDLLGIIERLDYLADLGVNALYLNPVFASASNHRYHTHDYFIVDPLLGGVEALRALLDAAHARGMRVVLDGVFNHASRGFFQFNHLLECGAESPYVDWFHVRRFPVNAYREDQPANYDAWWGLHALPKFNTDTSAVREFLWSVGTYWLEQGIDGWRLDVPNEIDDDAFWQEFRRRCRQINPDCYIVGELWGDARRWLQGDQFDAQMNYLFPRAALGYFGGDQLNKREIAKSGYNDIEPLDGIGFAQALDEMFNQLYAPAIVAVQMTMLDSHDTPRLLNMVNGQRDLVRLLLFAQMTVPGAPNIYYGSEIGLNGGHDPDCRRAFPWDDETAWDRLLLADVRRYVRLRRAIPALRRGDFRIRYADPRCLVFQRTWGQQVALVAINGSRQRVHLQPWPEDEQLTLQEYLGPAGVHLLPGAGISLDGRSGRVWVSGTTP